jgi:cell division protein FtsL
MWNQAGSRRPILPINPRARRTTTLRATFVSLLPAVLLALLFTLVGVFHVTSRVMVVSAGYELSRLEAAQRSLSMENDRLKLELATLKNPARLERFARAQLKLAPPAPSAVLSRANALPQLTAQHVVVPAGTALARRTEEP